ncbi:NAD-dependent epimerase/dehydratase family protein [Deinococcus sp. Arct2-2]|uniref:SDR family oxidoreductase n=1 Tax=Deinococcus sp. Arct2-2 TaxID=2568653 RepID=UPI0010A30011|nr:NAD(P)H-binding protein [Deinococcus sp. Arct2-2]THF68185.1 NAD-dependent epimerase/dehydratase family protein [Deinococcus sp. Arct2-2]
MNKTSQPMSALALPSRPILVAGATGAIGSQVVRALLARGAQVRVFVRSPEKVHDLPPEVERAVGTLEDRESIVQALKGSHAAFYVSPHDEREEQFAEHFVSACEGAGVRLVFSGVHASGTNRLSRFMQRTIFGLLMPHYQPKLRLAERVRTSHTNPVLLMPGNYFQMDEVCREELLAGRYPLPLGRIPRVDTRDVGEAAARALLDASVKSGGYALVGPESLSGEDTAVHWSAALGQPVQYAPNLAEMDALFVRAYGGRKALDCQKSYRLVGKVKMGTSAADLRQTTFLLGCPPRSFAEYAQEVAAGWQAAGPPVPPHAGPRLPSAAS